MIIKSRHKKILLKHWTDNEIRCQCYENLTIGNQKKNGQKYIIILVMNVVVLSRSRSRGMKVSLFESLMNFYLHCLGLHTRHK